MRFAIFSDIHGNIEAFSRVVQDISSRNIESCFFLGDAISYGPDPEKCVQLLKTLQIPCILGNHELALIRPGAANYFNEPTWLHFEQARKLLSLDSKEYMATWPLSRSHQNMLMVHGCPPASATRYLQELGMGDLERIFSFMNTDLAFVGHTHELEMVELIGHEVRRTRIGRGEHEISGQKAIINVGSVGQPRDGDNRAKYVIFDDRMRRIEVRFVEYDVEKTVQGIRARGFPEFYALRLR
ncbi:metallophosphoesterase family protein [Desulfonatronovibrio hydrogenovorans]|uniref:metallophosphoesterase family protein n=1 Tax=Desulfonatronovibrio hydrogenovorans TaxID=53245 RepID=UPI00048BD813|nr:metallophosphoesterase family protein [Desulfonatronovibrio hydrogenovorans]